jgi:epoxyqueuosine reductase
VSPYELDARRCISYLTIELKGSIPESLRPLIGNRVYGCDDSQLACPSNKYVQTSEEPDFDVRHGLDDADLTELFAWSESDFNVRMEGSAIRRIGFERWLRSPWVWATPITAMTSSRCPMRGRSLTVREHVVWGTSGAKHGTHSGNAPA